MKKLKQILFITLSFLLFSNSSVIANTYGCGDSLYRDDFDSSDSCNCEGGSFLNYTTLEAEGNTPVTKNRVCCGVLVNGAYWGGQQFMACSGDIDGNTPTPTPTNKDDNLLNTLPVPDAETLDKLNPLKIAGGDESLADPGTLVSKAVNNFVFPIAGIILFLMLVFGGFQMLMGAANSKSLEEGKQRVTSAIIGFIILFASYWIIQLIEIIFHLNILG